MILRTAVVLFLFPVVAFGEQRAPPQSRPNIIFILSDDHRWDALGAAGNASIKTPTLDRLARNGVYFRQATVYVSQCTPSRALLLSGLPPHKNGIYSIQTQRPDLWWVDRFVVPTVPSLMHEAGYRTVFIGKWHLAAVPWKSGFSDVRTWLDEGIASYRDAVLSRGNSREARRQPGFTNELFLDDAIAFLKSAEAKQQPFLLWFAMTAPHAPLQPNPEHIQSQYAGQTTADLLPPTFPEKTAPQDFLHYSEAVTLVDDITRRLLDTVAQRGLEENTLVVFMGDNGHMMGSRATSGKIVPYEESIRVPLIVVPPGTSGVRGTSDAAVSSLDLPVTFLKVAGITPPANWPGRDLSPLLAGREQTPTFEYAFGEWSDSESWFALEAQRLVRSRQYKLIRWEHAGKREELYDLIADPHEAHNLAADPAHRRTFRDLSNQLDRWLVKTADPASRWPKGGGGREPQVIASEPDRAAAEARALQIDTRILDELAGRYEMVNFGVISIERKGARLTATSNAGTAELIPDSEIRFLHPRQPLIFTFQRDAGGTVTGLVVRQRGYDRPARRMK